MRILSTILIAAGALAISGCGCGEVTIVGEGDGSDDVPATDDSPDEPVDTPDALPDGPPPVCGNWLVETGEACDDGPGEEWDGCRECAIVEFRVNESFERPSAGHFVAVSDTGDLVLLWLSGELMDGPAVMGKKISHYGSVAMEDFHVSVDPPTPGTMGAEAAHGLSMSPDGSFVAIWEEFYGPGSGMRLRLFDEACLPAGGEIALDCGEETGMFPDGGFVMFPCGDGAFLGQLFDPAGSAIGEPFPISGTEDYERGLAHVEASDDGRFVAVWESWYEDAYGPGIFGRMMRQDATPVTDQFQVNSEDEWFEQRRPLVDVAPDGRFVVVWEVYDEGGDEFLGYHARSFDASGSPIGPEFPLQLPEESYSPGLAIFADGSFAIAWSDSDDVFYRRFWPSGDAPGPAIRANVYVDGMQHDPRIDATPDGRLAISWVSEGQEGGVQNVYAQRFDAGDEPRGLLLW